MAKTIDFSGPVLYNIKNIRVIFCIQRERGEYVVTLGDVIDPTQTLLLSCCHTSFSLCSPWPAPGQDYCWNLVQHHHPEKLTV